MKTLMEHYVHAINDEKDAFWDYMDIVEAEPNKELRSIWLAIAADELQHYSKVKDAIGSFGNDRSDLERAFCHELHEQYEKMRKHYEKHK